MARANSKPGPGKDPRDRSPESGGPERNLGFAITPAPEPAKKAAERNFAEALRQAGFSELTSDAIARAVVDPRDARLRLQTPAQKRVPGGIIRYITTSVWAPAIMTFPTNFREAERRELPISQDGDLPFTPLAFPSAIARHRAELAITLENAQQLISILRDSKRFLLAENDLRPGIRLDGVLMPTILATAILRHGDGRRDVAVLVTLDGSSRLCAEQDVLGIEPEDAVYAYSDDRRLRQILASIRELSTRRPENLTESERAQVRSLILPAEIIVGVEHEPDSDFSGVVMSLLGQVHVDPPKRWPEGAELDAQGDAMLKELHEDGFVNELYRNWFMGMMTTAQAKEHGIPHYLDQRALHLLAIAIDHQRAASKGIRRVVPMASTPWQHMADVVAELAVRAYRSRLSKGEVDTARASLQRVYRYVELAKTAPWKYTGREPEELRDLALQEVEEKPNEYGAAASELGMLAAFWLTRHRILRRYTVAETDKREPHEVLAALIKSKHGIQVLYQALVDGRSGRVPAEVDYVGTPTSSPDGTVEEQTHAWLRQNVVPIPAAGWESPPPPIPTPQDELGYWMGIFGDRVDGLENIVRNVRSVKDYDGLTLVDREGWPTHLVEGHIKTLDGISRDLYRWMMTWQLRNKSSEEGGEEAPK